MLAHDGTAQRTKRPEAASDDWKFFVFSSFLSRLLFIFQFTISEVDEWMNTGTRVAVDWQTIGTGRQIERPFVLVPTRRNGEINKSKSEREQHRQAANKERLSFIKGH